MVRVRKYLTFISLLLSSCLLGGCGVRAIPVHHSAKIAQNCALELADSRSHRFTFDTTTSYMTDWVLGEGDSIQRRLTTPPLDHILKSELCAIEEIRLAAPRITLNRLLCVVQTGFSETSAQVELGVTITHGGATPSVDSLMITKLSTPNDTGPLPICAKGLRELLPKLVAKVRATL